MHKGPEQRISQKRQLLYIVAPLFLLLLCLGTINLAPRMAEITGNRLSMAATTQAPATATRMQAVTAVLEQQTPSPPPTATVTPSPTATPYIPPTFPPGTEIQLLGPPPESRFSVGDALSFYWKWPLALAENQYFALYLHNNTQEWLLGTVKEPNIGDSYRLQVMATDFVKTAATFNWYVQLETTLSDNNLAVSERRALTLIEQP